MSSILTAAEITALLAQGGYKRKRSTSGNNHWVRDEHGTLVKVAGAPPAAAVGKFEGKVGTKRRSRKGRTTTMPNGTRKYVTDWNNEVVMY